MPIIAEPEEKLAMNTSREPVRLSGYPALTVGLALVAAFLWSTGADLRQIVGALAIVALTSIGGLEFARHQVTPVRDARLPDGHVEEDL